MFNCITELDKRKPQGGDHGNQYTGGKVAKAQDCALGKSADETANTFLGISSRKVEQARTVLDKATDEVKEAVKSGGMTIN